MNDVTPKTSPEFTPEMALATRIGAVAIAILSAEQMRRVLEVVLEREPEFEEVLMAAQHNQHALAAAERIEALARTKG